MKDPKNYHLAAVIIGMLVFVAYHSFWLGNSDHAPQALDRIIYSLMTFIAAASIPESIYISIIFHTHSSQNNINPVMMWAGTLTWVSLAVYSIHALFTVTTIG